MFKNSNSPGNFLRSFFLTLIIACNLLFSVIFVVSILSQVLQKKEQAAESMKAADTNSGISSTITLGNIH